MKLKLEQLEGDEPRVKTLAIPCGTKFHARYYKTLHEVAAKKNNKLHKFAIQRLTEMLDEFDELLKISG